MGNRNPLKIPKNALKARYSFFQSAEVQKLWVLGKRQEAKVKREEKYVYLTYLILQLIQIPQIYGDTLLNKLRYVDLILSQEGNLISLSERLFSSASM